MSAVAKILIPNKEWIIKQGDKKLGTIKREKRDFGFLVKGKKIILKKTQVNSVLGVELPEKELTVKKDIDNAVYDYPCATRPYNPIFNIFKKLPIYAKSRKSKSLYCAGYYVIKFKKGWVKSYCPKLITLERYEFKGPYKTEDEMKLCLNKMNKEKE